MPEAVSALPTEEILKAAERLPPFPAVIWKVTALLRRMAPVREIEAVIKYDQAIAAKVLAMSRSAYYARRYAIGSLSDAIVALGDQQLIRVVMTACAARYFESEISGYELKEGELWQHAVATALIAETVARRLGKKKVLTIYTAALLHDIGKAVLSFYMKTYMDAILIRMSRKGLRLIDAERETFGVDHQELGEMIAQRWRFPPEVVVGIGYHHRPKQATSHQDIAAAVYVANRTATAMGWACGIEGLAEAYEDEIFEVLGISTSMVGQFWTDIENTMGEVKQLLSDESSLFGAQPEDKAPARASSYDH